MDAKPSSRPPIPDRALDYISDPATRETARYLSLVFREIPRPIYHMAGVVAGWSLPLQHDEPDHAALRRWRAGETAEDRARARLFRSVINYIEERVHERWPDLELAVNIPREDEMAVSRKSAAYQERRWSTEDSLRRLHRDWCYLYYVAGSTSEAARIEVANSHDVNPKKVERAITFCNKELEQGIRSALT